MVWSPETSCGHEQDKIGPLVVPYVQGRCLDVGCGLRKVWPSLIGVDNGGTFHGHTAADIRAEADDLSIFADGSMDGLFSSHTLEDFPRERVPVVLAEWARVIKIGGHLVLYVPSANLYPRVGEPGANSHHKSDFYPGDIEAMLKKVPGCGWELLESEERGDMNEYSLYIVAKKTESGWTENVWQRNPDGKKRALVIRYGGIGDMIMMSSILPQLKEQGYHITLNCKTGTDEVVRHDPNIDEWIVQATDFVPNEALGPYWDSLAAMRYDKIINLCESIEGGLLALHNRLQAKYPQEMRQKAFGSVNYVERTHDIAGVPFVPAPKFYTTEFERAWAMGEVRGLNGPVVLWAVNGSSPHKVWPWVQTVSAWLLERTPCHIFLIGDGSHSLPFQDGVMGALEKGGLDTSRMHPVCGKWSIRQTLTFAQVAADCVVGPETGVMNAVCMDPVAKVIYLSHSSETNLTRDWVNTATLVPDAERAPCYPCHLLHRDWENCHQHPETHAALCASAIPPEAVFRSIALAIGARKAA